MKTNLPIHKCMHCHCLFYKSGRDRYCTKCEPYIKLNIKPSDFSSRKEYERERYRLKYKSKEFRQFEKKRRHNDES